MLTQENVDQIFEEHEVWQRDSEAESQALNRVVFLIAQRRGAVLGCDPRLVDGIFAAWAICIPFFPQPSSYTQLMQSRRAEWFGGVSPELRDERAERFFTDSLLQLDLDGLAGIVAADDAAERIGYYLGSLEDPEDASAGEERELPEEGPLGMA